MSHYFDSQPQTEHQEKYLQVRLQGHDFRFKTDRSVFSRHTLDYGTQVLLDTLVDDRQLYGRLLDLGCGYGPVGIILKRIFPHLEVVMSDINNRAVDLARINARLNQVRYLDIRQSDGLDGSEGLFDLIVLNPPVRAGKKVVYRLFDQAYGQLRTGGHLYVVIQKKQGAPSAEKALLSLTQHVVRLRRQAGYWVLRATRPDNQDNGLLSENGEDAVK